jgi:hypothetical protein
MKSVKIGPKQPQQPAQILGNSHILQSIVEYCEPADHPNLLKASPGAFDAAISRPTAWARRYAPSQIDYELRTVFTSTHAAVSHVDDIWRGPAPKRRKLGTFGDDDWYLSTARPKPFPCDARSIQRIDRASRFAPLEDPYLLHQVLVGDEAVEYERRERQAIYGYLIDRGYRRAHGKGPRDCFHPVPAIIFALSAGIFRLLWNKASSLTDGEATFVQNLGFSLIVPAMLGTAVCVSMSGSHLLFNPVRYLVLNHCADALYREAIQQPAHPVVVASDGPAPVQPTHT